MNDGVARSLPTLRGPAPRRGRRGPFALALLPLVTLACQAPPATPLPPVAAGPCEGLAYVLFLIAWNEDRGATKEEQLEMAREGVGQPFAHHPTKTLRHWQAMVDLVYRRRDASPEEVQAMALDHCVVDGRGQAVLFWPKVEE